MAQFLASTPSVAHQALSALWSSHFGGIGTVGGIGVVGTAARLGAVRQSAPSTVAPTSSSPGSGGSKAHVGASALIRAPRHCHVAHNGYQ